MLKLARFLKPYTVYILIAIVLLFVQANAELALPDYMSRIVNVGIQQDGVESAVPSAIRASQMDRLVVFMTADEQAQVLSAYKLLDPASTEAADVSKTYPLAVTEPIYTLNTTDKTNLDALSPIMSRALVTVTGLETILADPQKAAAMGVKMGFDLTKLPPGTDLFTLLGQLPAAQKAAVIASINQQFTNLDTSLVEQMAVRAVKTEYTALGMDTSTLRTNYILRVGLNMLLVSLLSVTCVILVSYFSARTGSGFSRDLRKAVFKKVTAFSPTELETFSTASLITRSTNDVTQLQMLIIMGLRMVIYAPIMGIGGTIRALNTAPGMWWIIAVAVLILLGIIGVVFSIALPKFKIVQSLIDRLNLVVRENLSGMMVVRAFNRQGFEEERFDRANKDLTSTNLFINRIMVVMMPLMMLIMNGLTLTIIWVGAKQVANSTMQVGDMMAFMQYAMQIVFSFLMMSIMFIILPRAAVSGDRIAAVLGTEPTIKDPEVPATFPQPFKGTVEFRDVCFMYPDSEECVIQDINFKANPGETTAFIGSTGSGKSTVISLIPRFYDTTHGSVLIDGIDVRTVSQHDLRDKIGYVPQKGLLFTGTVESNLRFAREDASQEDMDLALDISQASKFVEEMPDGIHSEISQGGANVSGGQKQRLSIARAVIKKPPIYIFDDSFSALDFKTDSDLRKALREQTAGSTVFIVSQRVSTIKNADQIIVLDEGRIVGKGKHKQLMETCEVYRDIAQSQLSQEELA